MRCKESRCDKCASYNFDEPGLKPVYCPVHKKERMVNLRVTKCIICHKTGAGFNVELGMSAIWCKGCAPIGSKCVRGSRCPECGVRASFNEPGETRPIFCIVHKTPTMVDVQSQRCAVGRCPKQPYYGFDGKASHCAEHKDEGMKPAKSKRCIEEECSSFPVYGIPGGPKIHCGVHAGEDERNAAGHAPKPRKWKRNKTP